MKIYKIRDKETGLFSSGGNYVRFSNKGKIWNGMGPLKNHINGMDSYDIRAYINAEIVEFEVVEKSVISLLDLIDSMNTAREEKRAKQQKLHEDRMKAQRFETFQKLSKEFSK